MFGIICMPIGPFQYKRLLQNTELIHLNVTSAAALSNFLLYIFLSSFFSIFKAIIEHSADLKNVLVITD